MRKSLYTESSPEILAYTKKSCKKKGNGDLELDEEEWCQNLQFDSYKVAWDASDTEDDVYSEDEQDFLDGKEEEQPRVNMRRYRNDGLYIALMCTAIHAGDDPRDEDWVPKKTSKKLQKEKTGA